MASSKSIAKRQKNNKVIKRQRLEFAMFAKTFHQKYGE